MNCKCNENQGGKLAKIKHVYGNVLKIAIPLTLRTLEKVGEEIVSTDTDFIPSREHPVLIQFRSERDTIAFEADMEGNIANIEDLGTIPVGVYSISVLCKDSLGHPYRFKQRDVLSVVEHTADAEIEQEIEFEGKVWYLDAGLFLALDHGSTLEETDPIFSSSAAAGITSQDINTWNNKQSAIADLDDIRRGAALGETALQEHQDISGKANSADLAEVATSGSYNDLKNKPTIPAEQVNADWNASSGKAQILNKPTIPSKTSELVNDSGFITASQVPEGADLSTVFADVAYDSQTHHINFYGKGDTNHQTVLAYLDASPFIVDGMVDDVTLANGMLTITFNTASGKQPITLSLGDIFNANNYYTKTDTDTLLGGKVDKESGKSLMTDAERTKLAGIADGAEVNVQSDWNQTNASADDFIKNKPSIPAAYDDSAISGRVAALENAGFINKPLFYGTCATAAANMPKVCTVEAFPTVTENGVTHAKDGTIIAVKFSASDTNTTDAPTLNVNGIGAKAIMYNNAIVTSTAKNTTVAGTAKMIAFYRYDSSLDGGDGAWEFLGKSVDSNTTFSAMTQTEINSGATTTARTISPKLLRDNFILKSEVFQQFLENGCKCLTMTFANGVYSFFDTYDDALNHEEVINLIYEFFEENFSYVTIQYNGLVYIPYSYIGQDEYGFMSVDIANGVIRYLVLTDVNSVINVSSSSVAIPSSLSDLASDTTHRTVTDAEKAAWNGKVEMFVVNISKNGNVWVADKTGIQIAEAFAAGKLIVAKKNSVTYQLNNLTNSIEDGNGEIEAQFYNVTPGEPYASGFGLYVYYENGVLDTEEWSLLESVYVTDDMLDNYVPKTRTVNGKALSSNVTLNASDVGAVAIPTMVTVSTSGSVSQQLVPNTFYKFTGGVSSLTLTLDTTGTGLLTYFGKFVTASSGCQLSLPSTLTEAAGNATIEGGKIYEFHIVDNVIRISEV